MKLKLYFDFLTSLFHSSLAGVKHRRGLNITSKELRVDPVENHNTPAMLGTFVVKFIIASINITRNYFLFVDTIEVMYMEYCNSMKERFNENLR